jgi:hypothetical protein
LFFPSLLITIIPIWRNNEREKTQKNKKSFVAASAAFTRCRGENDPGIPVGVPGEESEGQ